MGTNNFHVVNASRYFVVFESTEDEETGETICPDQWDYEEGKNDFIEFINEEAEKAGLRVTNTKSDPHELRSYGSGSLTAVCKSCALAGVDLQVTITAVVRSGYYDGATLDWHMYYDVDGRWSYGSDELPEVEEIEDSWETNLRVIHARKAINRLEAMAEELSEFMEQQFSKMSGVELAKVGQFSNGEAVYKQIDKLTGGQPGA